MEHLLVGQLPLLRNRQHGAVNMWTFLIEVYIKPYDVILTPLLTCKAVHIQCPLFDFRHTFDMGVVSLTIQVHILSAKGEFHHAVMVARKYDFRQRVARRCLLPLIGVFDAQFRKTFRHTFRDGLRFVDRLYLTAFRNLEVQMVACRVILPASHLHLLRMVIPFPLVFVAFVHGHSLAGFDVHDLFLSTCHIYDIILPSVQPFPYSPCPLSCVASGTHSTSSEASAVCLFPYFPFSPEGIM